MAVSPNDEKFEQFFKNMEKKIKDLSDTVSENVIPGTQESLRKNIFLSIGVAFVSGLVLGILISLFGKSSGKKRK